MFLMGDGGTIENLGRKSLNLSDASVDRNVRSVFQIATVIRPHMSVGKMCDLWHDALQAMFSESGRAGGADICRTC